MRKSFDPRNESFREFAASLSAGDTALLAPYGSPLVPIAELLNQIHVLLRKGVVVRTALPHLDALLTTEPQAAAALCALVTAIDRRGRIGMAVSPTTAAPPKNKQLRRIIEAHRLIVQQQLSVVEACRQVKIRPTAYYLSRHKIQHFF